ncbi:MAG: PilZ domain-containing protein [Oscillibacter sp.]|nr:PilZ domain-containing protein [Oscillibacter sp.]
MTEYECIISDSQNQPLASAVLESRPQDTVWRIRVPEADIQRIISYGIIRVISLNDRVPNVNAEILSQPEPDLLTVSPSAQLDASIRLELRIPVRFDSFLYSLSPRWSGRVPIVSQDMSCGGIAFFCHQKLSIGETAELVIPVTTQPIIAKVQVLRFRPSPSPIPLVAAKFMDIIHDEEIMIREAVFCQQLRNHSAGRQSLREKELFCETR